MKHGHTLSPSLGFIVTRCNNNFLWLLYWSDLIVNRTWLTLQHRTCMWLGAVCVTVHMFAQPCLSWSQCTSNHGHLHCLSSVDTSTWRERSWGSLLKICSATVPSLGLYGHVLLLTLPGAGGGHLAVWLPQSTSSGPLGNLEETRAFCVTLSYYLTAQYITVNLVISFFSS